MKMQTAYISVITHSRNFGYNFVPFTENYQKLNCQSFDSNLNFLFAESQTTSSFKCKWANCGKYFSYLDDLAAHVSTFHSNSGPGNLFYCRWDGCSRGDRGFNARYKMLVHVRTHTNEKPHQCYQCQKCFSRAENLKIHARSHTGERPYVCPVPGCGKAYSNSSDRFKHTRTHSVHKPYVCKMPTCGKRYTDPSSLRKHVKTYRHFPVALTVPDENVPERLAGNDESTPTARNNQNLKEDVLNQMPFVGHLCLENAKNGLPFAFLKKWLRSESVFKSFVNMKVEENHRYNHFFQEQDSPLDLTIRK